MQKLDWYILKKFLVTFFFCLILFTTIAVAVDTSEKTDNFVSSGLSTMELIQQYYAGFIPWIWGLLFPVFVFISVIFFTSRLAMGSEIVAILASGVSYNRILRPYIIGGLFFALLLWIGNRTFIPKANYIRSKYRITYLDKDKVSGERNYSGCYNCFYMRADTNTFVGIKDFYPAAKTGYGFFLQKVQGEKIIYNLRGNLIRWDTTQQKWQLQNALERIVDSMGEKIQRYDSLYIDLNIKPEELRKDEYLKDKLTTPELHEFIKKEELRGTEGLNTLKVEYYRRTATPFAVFLLTMIGVVISSRRIRGGSGLHLAYGIAIAALFILFDRFSTVFSTKGNFSPLMAAWLPNFVFMFVAWVIYRFAPK